MFREIFLQLLNESVHDNTPNNRDSIGNPIGKRRREGSLKPHKRHQGIGPGIGAKNQQLVPDDWKTDATKHPAVEELRNKPSGMKVLHKLDVKQIMDLYKLKNLSPDKPRQLSNCGIVIGYNPQLGKYTLTK